MWFRALYDAVRSGRWRSVRAAHLKREPACQCCNRTVSLEVHHIRPVHADGGELDEANLITLCRDCHFCVGHGCDWMAWRPEVKELAKLLRDGVCRE